MEKVKLEKSNGGTVRSKNLSSERRSEIAKIAAKSRWEKNKKAEVLPKVILKRDDLNIIGFNIPCAIVEDVSGESDGIRVLSETGITNAILGSASGYSKKLKKEAFNDGALLPVFIAPTQLKPFITNDLREGLLTPIEYSDSGRIMIGYDARILPVICDIWLKARESGVLKKSQLDKARKAEILMRGLAHVGIIAIVDEATGYEKIKARNSLASILEAFVAKELQPWVKKFPSDFYENIFRLRGLKFSHDSIKKPRYFGHITNDIIYKRLAPMVWKEIKKNAEKLENGRLKHRIHQHLSSDIGDPRLRDLIASVVTIMKLSESWDDFKSKIDRIHPSFYGEDKDSAIIS